ncbi:glycosyltransferase family 8 protein [Liquorilactobacillus nagelii]|uniref:glycosyltransferase family 8 protein n=1 Tax=Liquorilactobacillus nagelii TaxID=82688 RepID=UPI0039EC400C
MGHTRKLGVKSLNVLYTLDNGFKVQLMVSLNSLIKKTKTELNIFIIFDGMNGDDYKNLKKRENNRVKITFLDAPKISNKLIPDRGAKSQFYRLYIPEIFSDYPEIERVLYIDSDSLIESSEIENIFELDMNSFAIAAAIDPWSAFYKSLFNLEKSTNMFNDGVFLINIKYWKDNKCSDKLEKLIETRNHFIQADQGLLNELIHGAFRILDPKYNVISSYFEMNYKELLCYRKPVKFYSKNQIQNAVKNPCIVHFTSTFLDNRPWQNGSEHPLKKIWIEEAKLCGVEIKKEKFGGKKPVLKKIFHVFPRNVSVFLFGLLQAYIRPIFLKIKLSLGGE